MSRWRLPIPISRISRPSPPRRPEFPGRMGRGLCMAQDRGANRKTMTTTEQSYAITPQLAETLKKYQHIATFVGLIGSCGC